jgi:hypothetical protein
MENNLTPIESSVVLVKDNPTQLIRQATDVAGVCREIVLKTACNIQGKKYVKCEGWMAIATAHGCLASSRDVQKVEGGFTAIGEIRRISDGVVLATAEGFVGRDEKRWSTADEYACRAMVQTRAISRACRAAFAHVVVMMDAGLSTTPFEEVPEGGFQGQNTTQPTPSAPRPPTAPRMAKNADVVPANPHPEEADKDQRFRFLAALTPIRVESVPYFVKRGWLTEGQNLEDLPNKYVPTTKRQYDYIMSELQDWMDAEQHEPNWKAYPMPWGKLKDTKLGELDKKYLFGLFMNFEVERTYNGAPKKPESIAKDEEFRKMLDEAGEHYEWKKEQSAPALTPHDDDMPPF